MVLSGKHSGYFFIYFYFFWERAFVVGIFSKCGEIPVSSALGKIMKFAQF